MKHVSLFFVLALSLFIASCDGSSGTDNSGVLAGLTGGADDSGSATENPSNPAGVLDAKQQTTANGLSVLNDGLGQITWESFFYSIGETIADTDNWESLFKTGHFALGEIKVSDSMTITPTLIAKFLNEVGVELVMTMDNYQLQAVDGSAAAVSGTLAVGFAYESGFLQENIILSLNGPLSFDGGAMDGQEIEFHDLELNFNVSQISLGSPVSLKGTVEVNGLDVYLNSEILELLMSFI